jgi:hypothetical protein
MSTRSIKIGKCTVVIDNVPEGISEDELKSMAMMKLYQMNRDKAMKEMQGLGTAS